MINNHKIADLHIHSTASDGRYSPGEIIGLAKEKGFSCIALSDHDSVDGLNEALAVALGVGLEVIPAIELSTLYAGGEVHILGYFIDWRSHGLTNKLCKIQETRENRARLMIDNLRRSGLDIEWEEVQKKAGSSYVGRPHIASLLLDKGYISKIDEAFTDSLIGNGSRAYVKRYEMKPAEAMELIEKYSGVAVLAHPGFYKKNVGLNEKDISYFLSVGLKGIEVYHPKHMPSDIKFYMQIAKKYQLKITGGSDCHGGDTGGGMLMGQVKLDYRHVQKLRN